MTAPTVTALGAGQLARRGQDKPVAVARNDLLYGSDQTGWDLRANTDGLFTTADGSSSSYPAENIHDHDRVSVWRYGSSQTTTYLLIDAGAGNTLKADCVIFEGQGATLLSEVRVRCSNGLSANALDGDAETLCTETVVQDLHAVFLDSSYEARYWEIRLTSAGSQVHQLSQLWLGRQRQFDAKANAPYDKYKTLSSSEASEAGSGNEQRVLLYRDRRHHVGDWQFWTTEGLAGLRSMEGANESNGWSRPFWFCEDPDTAPDTISFVMQFGDGLFLPTEIGTDEIPDAIWGGDMREQMPRGTSAGP